MKLKLPRKPDKKKRRNSSVKLKKKLPNKNALRRKLSKSVLKKRRQRSRESPSSRKKRRDLLRKRLSQLRLT